MPTARWLRELALRPGAVYGTDTANLHKAADRMEQLEDAMRASHTAMSRVLSANAVTIQMPKKYWDELYDAFNKVRQVAFNWREVMRTPEAASMINIQKRLMHGGESPSNEDLTASLRWLAEVGIPAAQAMVEEAEERGMSIFDPEF